MIVDFAKAGGAPVVILGDAIWFIRFQYGLWGRLESGAAGRVQPLAMRWKSNRYSPHASGHPIDPQTFLPAGPSAGEVVVFKYGYEAERLLSPVSFVWPKGPAFVFYRAFFTPLRRGRLSILSGDPAKAITVEERWPVGRRRHVNLAVEFVERTDQRPGAEGVWVQSDRSLAGTFPASSYLAVVVSGGNFGSGRCVPVSPHRSVGEHLQFNPRDVRAGTELSLALWGEGGQVFRWTLRCAEVYGVVVKLKQRRTFLGRKADRESVVVTMEYWRR